MLTLPRGPVKGCKLVTVRRTASVPPVWYYNQSVPLRHAHPPFQSTSEKLNRMSAPTNDTATENRDGVRIDRWLWAARFFKTRGGAAEAIKGGKVSLNDDKVYKPAKQIKLGDRLQVRRDAFRYHIEVRALAEKRGSAQIAQTLYEESAESIAERERQVALIKENNQGVRREAGRPSKRDRRSMDKLKRQI